LPWRSSVDDLLCIDDLEVSVEASQAMLVLHGSAKYLTSPNCQREVAAAKRIRLPLVRVHDGDSSKNGLPLDELRRTAESHRLARQHSEYLFGRNDEDVIPWHRAIDFQLRSLAAIAERMLLATPAYESLDALPLRVQGALAWATPSFTRPVQLYTSEHNPAAAEVAEALHAHFAEVRPRVRTALETDPPSLKVCGARSTLGDGSSRGSSRGRNSNAARGLRSGLEEDSGVSGSAGAEWLLFLSPTCFGSQQGERLADEVQRALRMGLKPLMLWAPEHGPFQEIYEATPRPLVAAGLYGPLAIEWRGGIHRAVSLQLVARALGAGTDALDGGVCMARVRRAWRAAISVSNTRQARVDGLLTGRLHDESVSDNALELTEPKA